MDVAANGIPQSVTARQARRALNAAGLLDDIDAALATMPRDAQIEWDWAKRQSMHYLHKRVNCNGNGIGGVKKC